MTKAIRELREEAQELIDLGDSNEKARGQGILYALETLKTIPNPPLTFIKEAQTVQTGGNIMNDLLILEDDTFLVISSDEIGLYRSENDYDEGEEPVKQIYRYD